LFFQLVSLRLSQANHFRYLITVFVHPLFRNIADNSAAWNVSKTRGALFLRKEKLDKEEYFIFATYFVFYLTHEYFFLLCHN